MEQRNQPWNFHVCKVCHYRSKHVPVMLKHIQEVHKISNKGPSYICHNNLNHAHRCQTCNFQDYLKVNVAKHKEIHQNLTNNEIASSASENVLKTDYKCESCDFHTFSLIVLWGHICRKTDTLKPYHNNTANQSRKGRNHQYLKHTAPTKYIKPFKRNFSRYKAKCLYNVKSENTQNRSLSETMVVLEEKEGQTWFHCKDCNYKSKTKGNLGNHIYSKHTDPDKIQWFECQYCSYKGKWPMHLKVHIINKHKNVKVKARIKKCADEEATTMKCSVLYENTVDVSDLTKQGKIPIFEHKRDHMFHCYHCDYKSKTKGNLRNHIYSKHSAPSNIKWFQCKYCSYKAKWQMNLKIHIVNKHSNGKEAKTEKRNKNKKLVIRIRKCSDCSYKTTRVSCLKTHVLLKHTKEEDIKWFKCKHCTYKAKKRSILKKHTYMRHTHPNDIVWFQCNFCSYRSKMKQPLKYHLILKHNEEV